MEHLKYLKWLDINSRLAIYWLIVVITCIMCNIQANAQIPKLKELKEKKLGCVIVPMEKKGKWGYADEKGDFIIKPVFDAAYEFLDSLAIIVVDGKYGMINRKSLYVHEPTYSKITPTFIKGILENFIISVDNQIGLMSKTGKIIEPPQYINVTPLIVGKDTVNYYVEKGVSKGLMTIHGEMIISPNYKDIVPNVISNQLRNYIVVDQTDKKGLFNFSGSVIQSPEYEDIIPNIVGDDIENYFVVKNRKKGIISKEGKMIVPPQYEQLSYQIGIDGDYYLTSANGKYGYISKDLSFTCPPRFTKTPRPTLRFSRFDDGDKSYVLNVDAVYTVAEYDDYLFKTMPYLDYYNDISCVDHHEKKHLRAFTEEESKVQIKVLAQNLKEYNFISAFSEGMAAVCLNDKWGFINTKGEEIVPCKYDDVEDFSEGLAAVKQQDKWGFINKQGEVAISIKFVLHQEEEYAGILSPNTSFHNGLALVWKGVSFEDWKFGYINTKGEEVIPCKYDEAGDFSEGLACVGQNGNYFYINTKGEVVNSEHDFSSSYDLSSSDFSEGLARVCRNEKYGYINTKGKLVIPCKYDYAYDFHEGLAAVETNGRIGYVNTKGELVVPNKYGSLYGYQEDGITPDFNDGLAIVLSNEGYLWGYINTKGEEVIPCKYNGLGGFHEGFAVVEKDGKWGFVDKDGNCTFDYQ